MANKRVLILGGGFGGVVSALVLERKKIPGIDIALVSNKTHFEYHAALYRVVTGRSPLEVCIPLREVFKNKKVELISDHVVSVDTQNRHLKGVSGSLYQYDYLVIAAGSETAYFNIPGLKEHSFGFTSITEALKLKRHLHEQLIACRISDKDREEDVCRLHVIIVGGGASGTELAGELAVYLKERAHEHEIDPSLITIDIIEAAPRLLPLMPEDVSRRVMDRLRHLGVNIFLNRAVVQEEVENVYLRDMQMKTKTVIWTAGVKPAKIFSEIDNLELDKKGRVVVSEYLKAKGHDYVFVIGDGSSTLYSGMAQTAVDQAGFVAQVIEKEVKGQPVPKYRDRKPTYAIPVGPGWAAVLISGMKIYGRMGWILRRLADLQFFLNILPIPGALAAFQNGKTLCESCEVCLPETEN